MNCVIMLILEERIHKSSVIKLLNFSLYSYPFVSSHYDHAYEFFTLMSTVNLIDGFAQRGVKFSHHQATGTHCDRELYNCTRLLLLPSGDAIVTTELLHFDPPPFLFHDPYIIPFKAAPNGNSASQTGIP